MSTIEPADPEQPQQPPNRPTAPRSARSREARRRVFEFGAVLSRGFAVWIAGLPGYVAVALVCFLPYAAMQYWASVVDERVTLSAWWESAGTAAHQFWGHFAIAIVAFSVWQELRQRPMSLVEVCRASLPRLPAVLGVSVLMLAVWAVCLAPGTILALSTGGLDPEGDLGPACGSTLLLLVGTVAAVFLHTVFLVSLPVCMIEGIGPVASLRRSAALTKGSRWRLFWFMTLVGVMTALPVAGLELLLTPAISVKWGWTVELGVSLLGVPLYAAFTAILYRTLLVAHDGVASSDLIEVFD